MANYAKLENNIVVNVVVADQEWINTQTGTWYLVNENAISQHNAIIGAKYDSLNDIFIHPKPYPSWILNSNHIWEAPVSKPEDGWYTWDEQNQQWKLVNG